MTDAARPSKDQLLRALREIGKCLERAAAGEGIQLAAARGKLADLIDWQSDSRAQDAADTRGSKMMALAREYMEARPSFVGYSAEGAIRHFAQWIDDGVPSKPTPSETPVSLTHCPYCQRPADSDGSIVHVAHCAGLETVTLNRLQYDALRGDAEGKSDGAP